MGDEKLEELKMYLRSVLMSSCVGVAVKYLSRDYQDLCHQQLDYRAFGYSNLTDFLRSKCSDVCRLVAETDYPGSFRAYAVANEDTQHIEDLQKYTRISSKLASRETQPHNIHMNASFGRGNASRANVNTSFGRGFDSNASWRGFGGNDMHYYSWWYRNAAFNNGWQILTNAWHNPTWFGRGYYYNPASSGGANYYNPSFTGAGYYYNPSFTGAGYYYNPAWYGNGGFNINSGSTLVTDVNANLSFQKSGMNSSSSNLTQKDKSKLSPKYEDGKESSSSRPESECEVPTKMSLLSKSTIEKSVPEEHTVELQPLTPIWQVYASNVAYILKNKKFGMFSGDVEFAYVDKFKESLPQDWVKSLEKHTIQIVKDYGNGIYLVSLAVNQQQTLTEPPAVNKPLNVINTEAFTEPPAVTNTEAVVELPAVNKPPDDIYSSALSDPPDFNTQAITESLAVTNTEAVIEPPAVNKCPDVIKTAAVPEPQDDTNYLAVTMPAITKPAAVINHQLIQKSSILASSDQTDNIHEDGHKQSEKSRNICYDETKNNRGETEDKLDISVCYISSDSDCSDSWDVEYCDMRISVQNNNCRKTTLISDHSSNILVDKIINQRRDLIQHKVQADKIKQNPVQRSYDPTRRRVFTPLRRPFKVSPSREKSRSDAHIETVTLDQSDENIIFVKVKEVVAKTMTCLDSHNTCHLRSCKQHGGLFQLRPC